MQVGFQTLEFRVQLGLRDTCTTRRASNDSLAASHCWCLSFIQVELLRFIQVELFRFIQMELLRYIQVELVELGGLGKVQASCVTTVSASGGPVVLVARAV